MFTVDTSRGFVKLAIKRKINIEKKEDKCKVEKKCADQIYFLSYKLYTLCYK